MGFESFYNMQTHDIDELTTEKNLDVENLIEIIAVNDNNEEHNDEDESEVHLVCVKSHTSFSYP
jgi:hypothetical protein